MNVLIEPYLPQRESDGYKLMPTGKKMLQVIIVIMEGRHSLVPNILEGEMIQN